MLFSPKTAMRSKKLIGALLTLALQRVAACEDSRYQVEVIPNTGVIKYNENGTIAGSLYVDEGEEKQRITLCKGKSKGDGTTSRFRHYNYAEKLLADEKFASFEDECTISSKDKGRNNTVTVQLSQKKPFQSIHKDHDDVTLDCRTDKTPFRLALDPGLAVGYTFDSGRTPPFLNAPIDSTPNYYEQLIWPPTVNESHFQIYDYAYQGKDNKTYFGPMILDTTQCTATGELPKSGLAPAFLKVARDDVTLRNAGNSSSSPKVTCKYAPPRNLSCPTDMSGHNTSIVLKMGAAHRILLSYPQGEVKDVWGNATDRRIKIPCGEQLNFQVSVVKSAKDLPAEGTKWDDKIELVGKWNCTYKGYNKDSTANIRMLGEIRHGNRISASYEHDPNLGPNEWVSCKKVPLK